MIIVIFFVLLIVSIFSAIYLLTHLKRLNYGNLTLITGGVKVGKTMFSMYLVKKEYKRALKRWRRACRKAKRKYQAFPEKPLIYSNMPIYVKSGYSPLTYDLLTDKARFRYGSVVYFNELSFLAGSKDIKDEELNDILLKFFKTCAHRTRGGYFICDTQSPQDCHYTLKRSLSTYYMLIRKIWLPFFNIVFLRENLLVDGENTVAVDTMQDPQDSTAEGGKKIYVRMLPHSLWKMYDQYAYSSFTDHLPVSDHVEHPSRSDLKMKSLIRFRTLLQKVKKGDRDEKNS